ncbi:hypothetical protein MNBD_GAMMA16-812 [hydrothermal vent metagenome]|uniref:SH3b domain-containing protein n=1 Tax=hydrothermal vent metagenome TaxID=652676 RepID=A0A3B0ZQB2_9ZZZZ
MKRNFIPLVLIVFFAISLPNITLAQDGIYITDNLRTEIRSGSTREYRIINYARSGTNITIIETDEANKTTKIRLPSGKMGWVQTKHITNQTPARNRLTQTETLLDKLQNQGSSSQQQLASLTTSQQALERSNRKLGKENKKLSQELNKIKETAANALNLDRENQELKKRVFALDRDYQILKQQVTSLKDRSNRDWFVAGAGVLIAGVVFGLILPKLRFRRKSSWSSSGSSF